MTYLPEWPISETDIIDVLLYGHVLCVLFANMATKAFLTQID